MKAVDSRAPAAPGSEPRGETPATSGDLASPVSGDGDRRSGETRPSLLPAGRQIASRYEVVGVIGEGASGIVYEARDLRSGGRVALKVIHRHLTHDRQIFGRFQREAAILKRLEGQHLVKLLDSIQEDGLLIIALEHVDGVSLESRLERAERTPGDFGPEDAVEIGLQICAALGVAHAAGVIHRDLKPANVLLERLDGARGPQPIRVRVVDFGLAKVVRGEQLGTNLTEQDMIFGTPEYMAPEQARGDEVDLRCDLYATGVMLYEMVVGRVPFDGRTPIAKMTAHLTTEPVPPRAAAPQRGISPALDAVILRALAKSPDDRYGSARALAEALASARDAPLVIRSAEEPGEASAIEASDTDLSIHVSGLSHSTTLSGAVDAPGASSPDGELLASGPSVRRARSEALPIPAPSSAGGARWPWIVVAVVAALLGVLLGVLFGTR
jgi:eukaryotic-like serine/threonine-protein kinase